MYLKSVNSKDLLVNNLPIKDGVILLVNFYLKRKQNEKVKFC